MYNIRSLKYISIGIFVSLIATGCSLSFSPPQDAGVFYSDTEGAAWEQRVYVGQTEKGAITIASNNILFFTFHPTDENTFFASTAESGVYKTEDKGRNWAQTSLNAGGYPSFVLDPQTPSIQYAASGGSILKTADDGATWTQVYIERAGVLITSLAVDPINTNIIWAGNSSGGILKSVDYGNTWELNTIFLEPIKRIIMPNVNSSVLYVLLAQRGFAKTIDNGETWDSDIVGNLSSFAGAIPIQSFYLRPNTIGDIVLGSAYGILRSTDGGETWKVVSTVIPNNTVPISSVILHPIDQNKLFFSAGNIFYQSYDGGQTWKTLQSIPTSHLVTTLVFNANNYSELLAGITKIEN